MQQRVFVRSQAIFSLLLVTALGRAAAGQNLPPAFDLQLFRPSAFAHGVLDADVAAAPGHLSLYVGLWAQWIRQPLQTSLSDTGRSIGDIVSHRTDAELALSLGLWNRLAVGVSLPAIIYQDGLNTSPVRAATGQEELSSQVPGDVRPTLKLILMHEGPTAPGLALVAAGTVPTGEPRSLGGSPGWTAETSLTASKAAGRHGVTANLGYLHREEPMRVIQVEIDSELTYRLAYRYTFGRWALKTPWSLVSVLAGRTPVSAPLAFAVTGRDATAHPLEGRLGLQNRVAIGDGVFDINVGAGVGLLPGYGGAIPRAFLGMTYLTTDPEADSDGDGLKNLIDQCPLLPEDLDRFEDEDGCPDPDNDGDGIPDEDDDCPMVPEDHDGQRDEDGCPDQDIGDRDGDGIFDHEDQCPDLKEDVDGFEDTDGCPEPDNDKDNFPDLNDVCPDEAEDINGYEDDDGCPDEAARPKVAVLAGDAITLSRPLTFLPGQAQLHKLSVPILKDVASIINLNPQITAVEVHIVPTSGGKKAWRQGMSRARMVVTGLRAAGTREVPIGVKVEPFSQELGGQVTLKLTVAEIELKP